MTLAGGWQRQIDRVIAPAVERSAGIAAIDIGTGNLERVPELIGRHLPGDRAGVTLVADENTYKAAGARLQTILSVAGVRAEPFVYPAEPRLKPSVSNAEALLPELESRGGGIVAVGSGVINDLVKYAAHRLKKPYLCVATAASMDGYASAGSPLSDRGFKHTIPCAPPRVVVADMEVVANAPGEMAGWGYGDLAGKVAAGADWIVASALAVEPIDDLAWPLVHDHLRPWLAQAEGVGRGQPEAIGSLFAGLVITGLAMEAHGSSRPASGADHQIGHLWEMRDLSFDGSPVAHGACVALGTLSVLALYDWVLGRDPDAIDIDFLVESRATPAQDRAAVELAFGQGEIASRSSVEMAAKRVADTRFRERLVRLRAGWPALRDRLREFLISAPEMARMLRAAGVITDPLEVGIDRAEHRRTVLEARLIRRRYTVLDLLQDAGLLETAVDATFAPGGYWGTGETS